MTTEERMKFSQRYARFNTRPQSLFGKLLTLLLGATFLGVMLWGWLWWKTRAIRKEMARQMHEQNTDPAPEGRIIEGEVIREADEPTQSGKLLR
jgi:hypothetical protein